MSSYTVQLRIQSIELPPFQDILVLAMNSPSGKLGVQKALELIAPDQFKMIEILAFNVEAIYINKRILKKMNEEDVVKILKRNVFPSISEGELLNVSFNVSISSQVSDDSDLLV